METKILLLHEVAERLRVSASTVSRWLAQARQGKTNFPLPISTARGKGRWTAESIDQWVASQYVQNPFPNRAKRKEERRNERAFRERQAACDRALERFK